MAYDVVLLVEQALDPADAARIRSLHEGLDEPVAYHVILPVEDAAGRVEASLTTLAGGELAAPALALSGEELDAIDDAARNRAQQELDASVAALTAAGAQAEGVLVRESPVDALVRVVGEVDGREVIVLTRPHVVAELFRLDWTSQAQRRLKVPTLHLIEHESFDEQAGGGEGVTGL